MKMGMLLHDDMKTDMRKSLSSQLNVRAIYPRLVVDLPGTPMSDGWKLRLTR